MPTTTGGLPYPSLDDAPNGPAQIQALAEAVETRLSGPDSDIAAVVAAFAPISSGTWTPVVTGYPLTGAWTGQWWRQGIHMFALAKIVTTAEFASSNYPAQFTVAGLPVSATSWGIATGDSNYGNHTYTGNVGNTTIYLDVVHPDQITASNVPAGTILRVQAHYLVFS